MNIKIENTSTAIDDANILISSANKLSSIVATMRNLKKSFEDNWIEEGVQNENRQRIVDDLGSNIVYYENKIIPALEKLGNAVNAYAVATDQIAAASIENPSLMEMTPSQLAYEKSTIYDRDAYENADIRSLESKIGQIGETKQWETFDTMYNFFREKGLTDEQIAGIIGNATQESGLVLDIKNSGSSAKGLFQWLTNRYPDDWSIDGQLEHAWNEIQTYNNGNVIKHLDMESSSVYGSTDMFAQYFEGYTGEMPSRKKFAYAAYAYIKDNYY